MPFDALSEEYRGIEPQFYRLVGYGMMLPNTVMNIVNTFGIDELPALIISVKPIGIERFNASGTVILKRGAIDRLIKEEKSKTS